MTILIIVCLIIMLTSLSGAIFSATWVDRNMNYLLSFSSGVFLIIATQLTFEVIEHGTSLFISLILIGTGVAIFTLLDHIIPEGHHHHQEGEGCDPHTARGARKMLIGDGLHNLGDGIVLASAFSLGPVVGFATAIGIFIHELVQEISEFFVLRQAGNTVKQALTKNFLVSTMILVGAVGGFYLASFEHLESLLLAIAAGAFISIVLKDLIPNSIRQSIDDKKYIRHAISFASGMIIILIISIFTGEH